MKKNALPRAQKHKSEVIDSNIPNKLLKLDVERTIHVAEKVVALENKIKIQRISESVQKKEICDVNTIILYSK